MKHPVNENTRPKHHQSAPSRDTPSGPTTVATKPPKHPNIRFAAMGFVPTVLLPAYRGRSSLKKNWRKEF
jgi:hypothetical protein